MIYIYISVLYYHIAVNGRARWLTILRLIDWNIDCGAM
jgi:hypothetical protein